MAAITILFSLQILPQRVTDVPGPLGSEAREQQQSLPPAHQTLQVCAGNFYRSQTALSSTIFPATWLALVNSEEDEALEEKKPWSSPAGQTPHLTEHDHGAQKTSQQTEPHVPT